MLELSNMYNPSIDLVFWAEDLQHLVDLLFYLAKRFARMVAPLQYELVNAVCWRHYIGGYLGRPPPPESMFVWVGGCYILCAADIPTFIQGRGEIGIVPTLLTIIVWLDNSHQRRQPFIGLQSSEIVTLSQFQFLLGFEYSHILFYYKVECFKMHFKI